MDKQQILNIIRNHKQEVGNCLERVDNIISRW